MQGSAIKNNPSNHKYQGTGGVIAEKKPVPLPWQWATDLEPNCECNDFVEGVLTKSGMSVIYGPSGSGKSFVVISLAGAVASGLDWYGKECDQGAVIYLAAEGAAGVQNRLAAMTKEGLLREGARLVYVPCCIDILKATEVAALVATVEEAAAGIDVPVSLIILDTLSRCMAGANENAPEDMTAVVAAADGIRKKTGAHVLFVHHSGKNVAAGSRGHSSLRAATDTEIEIQRDEGEVGQILCRKAKDLEFFAPMAFKLRVVKLGTNRRGKAVTSCVIDCVDAADVPQKQTAIDCASGIILKGLMDSMDGLNTTEIWALKGVGNPPKTAAIKALLKDKKITLTREGNASRYRLQQQKPPPPQFDPNDYRSGNPAREKV